MATDLHGVTDQKTDVKADVWLRSVLSVEIRGRGLSHDELLLIHAGQDP